MSLGCVDDTMRAGAREVDAVGGRRGGRPALGPRPRVSGPWYVRPSRAETGSAGQSQASLCALECSTPRLDRKRRVEDRLSECRRSYCRRAHASGRRPRLAALEHISERKRSHAAPHQPSRRGLAGRCFEGPWEAAGGAAEACGRLSYSCVVDFIKYVSKRPPKARDHGRKTSFYKSQNNCKDKLCKPFELSWPPARLLKHSSNTSATTATTQALLQACLVFGVRRSITNHQAPCAPHALC